MTATTTPTAVTAAAKTFYVVFSPRGFANEIAVRSFATNAAADDFRVDTDNDANSWTVAAGTNQHRRAVAAYKANVAYAGTEYADDQGYGYKA